MANRLTKGVMRGEILSYRGTRGRPIYVIEYDPLDSGTSGAEPERLVETESESGAIQALIRDAKETGRSLAGYSLVCEVNIDLTRLQKILDKGGDLG